jgi:hypothetical protein
MESIKLLGMKILVKEATGMVIYMEGFKIT